MKKTIFIFFTVLILAISGIDSFGFQKEAGFSQRENEPKNDKSKDFFTKDFNIKTFEKLFNNFESESFFKSLER